LRGGASQRGRDDYLASHPVDLLVMGAYSQGRNRHYVAGSTIAAMLQSAPVSCLVVR